MASRAKSSCLGKNLFGCVGLGFSAIVRGYALSDFVLPSRADVCGRGLMQGFKQDFSEPRAIVCRQLLRLFSEFL